MICIGFGANDSLRSKLIRWATGSEYSHVWIEYPSTCWGGQWVAHSAEHGVVKEPCERVRARYDRTYIFEVKDFDLTPGMQASKELLGRRYDFKVIWNGLLLVLNRVLKSKWLWKLAAKDMSKLSCSEFVTVVMMRAGLPAIQSGEFVHQVMGRLGIEGATEVEPEFVTPGNLFRLCKSSKTFWTL